MKKALKVIGRVILAFLIFILLIILICFFYQKSAQKKDRALLEKDGFINLVSAGDYDMNINIYGDGKYKIIAMPGSGDAEFTVDMKMLKEHLRDDISLVCVSRPGYGLCEETEHDITTEYIVESTRTALKNAGIETPYILMPHSMSGIYATYWESTYPDEISGVIFLDSINEATKETTDEEWSEPPSAIKFLCNAGVFRAITDLFGASTDDSYGIYKEDAAALYGINPTAFSDSCISELKNFNTNMKTAWASIKSNHIPKVYISTDYQTLENVKEYLIFTNGESDEERAQELFDEEQSEEQTEYRKNRTEYINKLGNCKEINMSGSHFIYYQKPDACAEVIENFLDGLE